MAKCSKCGKSGLFFKVNTQGKCKECERIENLLEEENEVKSQIELLNTKRAEIEKSYESIKITRDALYSQISEKQNMMRFKQSRQKLTLRIQDYQKLEKILNTRKSNFRILLKRLLI